MKICVYGAGAVGGHVAARLAAGGQDVSLIARGAEVDAIRTRGLRVTTAEGELVSRPRVTEEPGDLPAQDLVVVAVKAPVLPLVAQGIGRLLTKGGLALFINNGVPWWYGHRPGPGGRDLDLARLDPEGLLRDHVGASQTAGAVAYTAGTVHEPGVILAQNPKNRLVVGRADGQPDQRLNHLAEVLAPTGLAVTVSSHIRDAVWAKLLVNLVGGSIGLLTGSPTADVMRDPDIAAAARAMASELADVARVLGCDPGDPAAAIDVLGRSTRLQSVVQDLQAGRPLELDAMFRAPLDLARRAGVLTPTADLVVGLAVARASGG